MIGMHYGEQKNEETYNILLEDVKNRDKTDNLNHKLSEFTVISAPVSQKLALLNDFMLNEGQKFSATQMEHFASALTSRFLPLEIKRQYYQTYFALLPLAVKGNSNMYISKLIRGLTPYRDQREYVSSELYKFYLSLDEKDSYIKDLIFKLNLIEV